MECTNKLLFLSLKYSISILELSDNNNADGNKRYDLQDFFGKEQENCSFLLFLSYGTNKMEYIMIGKISKKYLDKNIKKLDIYHLKCFLIIYIMVQGINNRGYKLPIKGLIPKLKNKILDKTDISFLSFQTIPLFVSYVHPYIISIQDDCVY